MHKVACTVGSREGLIYLALLLVENSICFVQHLLNICSPRTHNISVFYSYPMSILTVYTSSDMFFVADVNRCVIFQHF